MRVKPRRGRAFTETDGTAGTPVVMVNESFAERIWPGDNAVGKRLRLVKDSSAQPWLTVVGVLPNILQNARRPLDHDPLIYLPYAEEPQREIFIVAKTRVPPSPFDLRIERLYSAREVSSIESRISLSKNING